MALYFWFLALVCMSAAKNMRNFDEDSSFYVDVITPANEALQATETTTEVSTTTTTTAAITEASTTTTTPTPAMKPPPLPEGECIHSY